MIMDVRKQRPPNLQPTWAIPSQSYDLDGMPRTAFRVARTPLPTESPISPHGQPMLMNHSTSDYDRAVVQKLDTRGRSAEEKRIESRYSSADTEGTCLTARLQSVFVATPTVAARNLNQSTSTNRIILPKPQTLLSETRSILLADIPESKASSLVSVVTPRTPTATLTSPIQRRAGIQTRQQLRAWGHVYLGDALKADVFVAATALRARTPGSGYTDGERTDPNIMTIRARVRPRSLRRRPFIIQRDFNLGELRATVPDSADSPDRLQRRHSVQLPPRAPQYTKHRRPTVANILPPAGSDLGRAMTRTSETVPIHLAYARMHLPALAALMMSGHIDKGDIIDLPLPRPEAWLQTVTYVYTGQGELTEAVKQNITHLAGRV